MAGETVITVVGNLTGDPELRYSSTGTAMARFTIASTPRNFSKDENKWVDGEALFLRCTAWRQLAENSAETLARGNRVIAQGRLRQRSYETKEGEKRMVFELEVDEIGPSLKYATAKVAKAGKASGGARAGGMNDDPWASAAPAGKSGSSFEDDPPF